MSEGLEGGPQEKKSTPTSWKTLDSFIASLCSGKSCFFHYCSEWFLSSH